VKFVLIYIYKIECLCVYLFVKEPIKQEPVLPIPPKHSRT
jgi:hypothetical protein